MASKMDAINNVRNGVADFLRGEPTSPIGVFAWLDKMVKMCDSPHTLKNEYNDAMKDEAIRLKAEFEKLIKPLKTILMVQAYDNTVGWVDWKGGESYSVEDATQKEQELLKKDDAWMKGDYERKTRIIPFKESLTYKRQQRN